MDMPPKEGMAMGSMMSAPLPVEVRIGIRARIVVALVIRAGRMRRSAPSMTIFRMLSRSFALKFDLDSSRKVDIRTPSSVAMPNRARKPPTKTTR